MTQPAYTDIPDTSDSAYWIISYNGQARSTTFVPRDKELHQQLKAKAWKEIQAKNSYKDRRKKNE